MPASRSDRFLGILSLLCLAAMVILAKASESTLPATDAATHADLALNATAHGWLPLLPIGAEKFGGHWSAAGFNDHPLGFFYLSGWVMRLFGPDAWSAKLVPAFFSVGCVFLTVLLGTSLGSVLTGVVAGIMLTTTRHFIIDGVNAHLDDVMLFFILASFVYWMRGRAVLAGVAVGLGLWFKSPVAFLLFPTMGIYHLVRFELFSKIKPLIFALLAALLVGSGIWAITGMLGGWDLVRDYWVRQFWGTAVGGRGASQVFDPLAFVGVFRSHFMPWSIFFGISIAWNVITFRFRKSDFLVPFIAGAIMITAISLLRFKYDHYYVPAYPFLALIAALPIGQAFASREAGFYRVMTALILVAATVILCSRVNPAPESFPALRKFMAIIQSYGDCKDRILLVEGNEPYGLPYDYEHLLHFYTDRPTRVVTCAEAKNAVAAADIRWILVSGSNYEGCIDADIRMHFPRTIRYGRQYLLAREGLLPDNKTLEDLTPLGRELKAALDCKPAPLPQDRYH